MKIYNFIILSFFISFFSNNVFAASTDPLNAAPGNGSYQYAPYGIFQTKTLIIAADFPDKPTNNSESQWSSVHTQTVDFWNDVSKGKATLTPANESYGEVNNGVIEITYDNNFSYFTSTKQLLRDAIIKSDLYIDYSSFDENGDGYIDTDELAIQVVIHGKSGGNGLDAGNNPPVLDGVIVGDYRNGAGGVAFTGSIGTPGHTAQNVAGIIIHEFGHTIFKLHDFYGEYGIAGFGIMSGGSGGRTINGVRSPTMPTPWTQLKLGWINVQEATGTESIVAMGSNLATDSNTVFKVSTDNPDQYFLIANIQDIGRNQGLQTQMGGEFEGGLIIYHIDDSVIGTSRNIRTALHRIVEIEKPGGPVRPKARDLDTDTFWSSNNASVFNGTSTPNSNNNDGSSTGVNINSISESGEVMTFNVGAPNTSIPVLINPTSAISDTSPTFTWNAVPGSTGYTIRIYNSLGGSELYYGATPSSVNCANGTGICSYYYTDVLDPGSYTWKVKSGNNSYSPIQSFTIESGASNPSFVSVSAASNTSNQNNLIDGNNTTQWNNTTPGVGTSFDLFLNGTYTISSIDFLSQWDSKIIVEVNGQEAFAGWTENTGGVNYTINFTTPLTGNVIRIKSQTGQNWLAVKEVSNIVANGAVNGPSISSVSAASNTSNQNNLIDGNSTTQWNNSSSGVGTSFDLNLNGTHTISSIDFLAQWDSKIIVEVNGQEVFSGWTLNEANPGEFYTINFTTPRTGNVITIKSQVGENWLVVKEIKL